MFRTRVIFGGTMDNYISMEKLWNAESKCIKILEILSLWLARASLHTWASLNYPHPRYLLHQNKLHYIDQHLIGYQSVSGFKNIRNIFPVTLHDLWFDNMARSEMQEFSFSILWSCIVGLFWNVHCIGKVVLNNKFNFTSAVIRSIDLLVYIQILVKIIVILPLRCLKPFPLKF